MRLIKYIGRHIAMLLLSAAVITACFEPRREPSSSEPSPAKPTVQGEPQATRAPVGARHFIYSTEIDAVTSASRRWPTRAIVSFDVDAATKHLLVRYGGINDYPVKEAISERNLYFATEKRLVRLDLDGSRPGDILRWPATEDHALIAIQDFDISPDASKLAVTVSSGASPAGFLIFLDAHTGAELARVDRSHSEFSNFRGYFWRVHWRDDSNGVVVSGGTSSERPGGKATIFSDGRIFLHDLEGFVNLADDGRRASEGPGALCGGLISGNTLRLRDLDSGNVLASRSDSAKAFTGWAWAPNGNEFLYQERAWNSQTGCGNEVQWHVLSSSGSVAVPNLNQLFVAWYGEQLVELVCEGDQRFGPAAALLDRWADRRQQCWEHLGALGELRLAGKGVDKVHDVFVLGFRGF